MSSTKFDASKSNGIHSKLLALAGEWTGTSKVWFEPDKLEDEATIKGVIRPVLGGRFIMHEYETSFKGDPISGIAIHGYSIGNESFKSAWIDSFHTGTDILFSESQISESLFSALGSYGGKDMPEPWGWRTTFHQPDANKLIITAYNIMPGSDEIKATEIEYIRSI